MTYVGFWLFGTLCFLAGWGCAVRLIDRRERRRWIEEQELERMLGPEAGPGAERR